MTKKWAMVGWVMSTWAMMRYPVSEADICIALGTPREAENVACRPPDTPAGPDERHGTLTLRPHRVDSARQGLQTTFLGHLPTQVKG